MRGKEGIISEEQVSRSRAEWRREFHLQLDGWPGSILSDSPLNPTAMKAALLEEMFFPTGEALRNKPSNLHGNFRELKELLLTVLPRCSSSCQYWAVQETKSAKTPWLTGDSWRALAPANTWRWAQPFFTLSVVPALAALPSPWPLHCFPRVLSKSCQATAEYENRQEETKMKFFWHANDELSSAFFLHWRILS